MTAEELAQELSELMTAAFDMTTEEVGDAFLNLVSEMDVEPEGTRTFEEAGLMTNDVGVVIPTVEDGWDWYLTVQVQPSKGW